MPLHEKAFYCWAGILAGLALVGFAIFALNLVLGVIHPDCLPHITHGAVLHCVRL